jgi:hypothetical protein
MEGNRKWEGGRGNFLRKFPPSKPLLFLSKDFRKWDRI